MSNTFAGGSESAELTISNTADWKSFPSLKFDVIVDPMIFRSGYLFLQGAKAFGKTDAFWEALERDLNSLLIFFDTLILSEKLSLIDLIPTFGEQMVKELVELCNQKEPLLTYVHVNGQAYKDATKEAETNLNHRLAQGLRLDLAPAISAEMTTYDYAWDAYFPQLNQANSEDEKALLRFMFGGFLFNSYARSAKAGHLIHPRRSTLYIETSLAQGSNIIANEEELFQEMKKMSGSAGITFDLDALPHFLPYLLRSKPKPKTLLDLLDKALALRKNGAVKDYREWRLKMIRDWRDEALIEPKTIKKINKSIQAVKLELKEQNNPLIETELKLTFVGIPEIAIPIGKIINDLWGWTVGNIPGHRYSKLLMRMTKTNFELRKVAKPLRKLWENTDNGQ